MRSKIGRAEIGQTTAGALDQNDFGMKCACGSETFHATQFFRVNLGVTGWAVALTPSACQSCVA